MGHLTPLLLLFYFYIFAWNKERKKHIWVKSVYMVLYTSIEHAHIKNQIYWWLFSLVKVFIFGQSPQY